MSNARRQGTHWDIQNHRDEEGEDREVDLEPLPTEPLPEVFRHGHHLRREKTTGIHLEPSAFR